MRSLIVHRLSFPIRGSFRISRGAKTAADVVVVEISEAGAIGRGECVPYGRYGETMDGVVAAIEARSDALTAGMDRLSLNREMPAGAARNAIDCALWDLEAKLSGVPAWQLAGLSWPPQPLITAFTISVDTPEAMAAAALAAAGRPLLKLKLAGFGDIERVRAVRAAVPEARLIADANESWSVERLRAFAPEMAALRVEMIEQPLPADEDNELAGLDLPLPLVADESCHGRDGLDRLKGRYQLVNIKLDKTGGLTEALRLKAAAKAAGFGVMVGCMVSSSLAMAPAMLVAQGVQLVDLDGPLLLLADRQHGLRYDGARIHPPQPELWG
ncbi:MAG: N-acetyl-D-Glu racemase DgcA [Rhodospirillaceae bacterium]